MLSVVEYSFTVVWVLSVVLGSFLALVVVGVLGLEVVGKMVLKVGKDVLAVGWRKDLVGNDVVFGVAEALGVDVEVEVGLEVGVGVIRGLT